MSTFLKLHHGFLDHEKHAELTNSALLLHISGLMYASDRLTDGRLPKAPAVRIAWSARLVAEGCDTDALIRELIDAGVWVEYPDRWEIVNYARHNNTKAQVDAIRESDRARKQKQRAKKPPETQLETETDGHPESRPESRRDIPSEPALRAVPDPPPFKDLRKAVR